MRLIRLRVVEQKPSAIKAILALLLPSEASSVVVFMVGLRGVEDKKDNKNALKHGCSTTEVKKLKKAIRETLNKMK